MFETVLFWVAIAGLAIVLAAFPAAWLRGRAAILSAVSVAVLVGSGILPMRAAALLIVATSWVAFGGVWVSRGGHKSRAWLVVFVPLLVLWVFGKQLVAVGSASAGLFYFLGISYVLVKAFTLLKDLRDGRIDDYDPMVAIAYFAFFPTYVAGPMHLFTEFRDTLRERAGLDGESLLDAAFRLVVGMIKIRLIAPLFTPISLVPLLTEGVLTFNTVSIGALAYSVVIYADFSGYSDVAIATARLLGIRTPENFSWPYLAPNLRDFWQRWHISFSRVLTSYAFVPLSRFLGRVAGDRPRLIMVLSYLVTFVVCGYWHGATSNFVVWGAFHGAGLIVYDVYRPWANKRRRKRKLPPPSPARAAFSRVVATVATFAFVSAGWIFFVLPLDRLFGR